METQDILMLGAAVGVIGYFLLRKDEPKVEVVPDPSGGSVLDGKKINGQSQPLTVKLDDDLVALLDDTQRQTAARLCGELGGTVSGNSCRLPGTLKYGDQTRNADEWLQYVMANMRGLTWDASTRTLRASKQVITGIETYTMCGPGYEVRETPPGYTGATTPCPDNPSRGCYCAEPIVIDNDSYVVVTGGRNR